MNRLLTVAALALAASGCAYRGDLGGTYWDCLGFNAENPEWGLHEERRQAYVAQNPELDPYIRRAILERRLRVGMTTHAARVSWALYGPREPRRINNYHGLEQWVLRGYPTPYLYFRNGALVSWQNVR